jgi:hypothetical protein
MFVASHPSDLEAATTCGLRACYVSRPLEYGRGVVVEQTLADGDFDVMVSDLVDFGDRHGVLNPATNNHPEWRKPHG